MSKPAAKGVDNIGRKKWDLSEYDQRAKQIEEERILEEWNKRNKGNRNSTALVVHTNLKARDSSVDLYSKVGKSSVVTTSTHESQRGGFWCEICECLLKDSISWLDHLNGKKHQKNLGMNMRVVKADVNQVRSRLEYHREKKVEETKVSTAEDVAARLERLENASKKKKKKKNKSNSDDLEEGGNEAPGREDEDLKLETNTRTNDDKREKEDKHLDKSGNHKGRSPSPSPSRSRVRSPDKNERRSHRRSPSPSHDHGESRHRRSHRSRSKSRSRSRSRSRSKSRSRSPRR